MGRLPVENLKQNPQKFNGFTARNSDLFTYTRGRNKGDLSVLLCRLQVVRLVFLHARVLLDVDIKRRQMKNKFRHCAKLSSDLQFLLKHLLQNNVCQTLMQKTLPAQIPVVWWTCKVAERFAKNFLHAHKRCFNKNIKVQQSYLKSRESCKNKQSNLTRTAVIPGNMAPS